MVFNVLIFIWVIVVLVRHSRNKAALQKEDIGIKSILRRMVSISGIMSLFGLTWLFAVFTFDLPVKELKMTFDSCFVIFNSFQGLFIFFFYIVLNKEIRESWKELLSCGRYQSKLLPHSQTRTTPKLGNSGSSGSTLPTGLKTMTSKSDFDTNNMKNTKAVLESDVIKVPPPLQSVLDSDELDKLSLKTVTSIKATVTLEETNETNKQYLEVTVSDDSKTEEEGLPPKVRIKCYTIQKYQVEQVEIDFYSCDDDSDKEDGK